MKLVQYTHSSKPVILDIFNKQSGLRLDLRKWQEEELKRIISGSDSTKIILAKEITEEWFEKLVVVSVEKVDGSKHNLITFHCIIFGKKGFGGTHGLQVRYFSFSEPYDSCMTDDKLYMLC